MSDAYDLHMHDDASSIAHAAASAMSSTSEHEAQQHHDDTIPAVIPIILSPQATVWYTTRLGGYSHGPWAHANMSSRQGDDLWSVFRNRRAVTHIVGDSVYTIHQVHSGDVVDADKFDDATDLTTVQADALISGGISKGNSYPKNLGIFTADCLPVLLTDPYQGVIAAAHCGRMGLMKDVISHTVSAMVDAGARVERIHATLGPCICSECYEVGSAIAMDFEGKYPGCATITRFGGPGVDLEKAALFALGKAGIRSENLVDSLPRIAAATQYLAQDDELRMLCDTDGEGPDVTARFEQMSNVMCTFENPLWYSHRRVQLAGKTQEGRQLSIITPYPAQE